MGRTRPVGSELDLLLAEIVLDLVGEELPAAVGLHPLHREGHLLEHVLEEVAGAGGGPARIEAHHLPAGGVVDGGVLIEAALDLAGIHLHAVAGYRPAVAPRPLAPEAIGRASCRERG